VSFYRKWLAFGLWGWGLGKRKKLCIKLTPLTPEQTTPSVTSDATPRPLKASRKEGVVGGKSTADTSIYIYTI
jgi:hypothetical protein